MVTGAFSTFLRAINDQQPNGPAGAAPGEEVQGEAAELSGAEERWVVDDDARQIRIDQTVGELRDQLLRSRSASVAAAGSRNLTKAEVIDRVAASSGVGSADVESVIDAYVQTCKASNGTSDHWNQKLSFEVVEPDEPPMRERREHD